MQILQRGQRLVLPIDFFIEPFNINFYWETKNNQNYDISLGALLISNGKLLTNKDFVYSINKISFDGSLSEITATKSNNKSFILNLKRVRPEIEKIFFVISISDNNIFKNQICRNISFEAENKNNKFQFKIDVASNERTFLLCNFYKNNNEWKLNTGGEAFSGDFIDILKRFDSGSGSDSDYMSLETIVEKDKDFSKKFEDLNNNYQGAKNIYDKLKQEITGLEEDLNIISYGIYKPHFDYDTSEKFKQEIENVRKLQKDLIKNGTAVDCPVNWTVGGSTQDGKKLTNQYSKLMLRAFNGECDTSILKVRWDNILKMEQRVDKSYESINQLGVIYNISIKSEYYELKLKELRLNYEYQQKKHIEREEQRRIQEQIREEEKAQRDFDNAILEAEKEEERYQRALEKAKYEIDSAKGKQLDELNNKIELLEQRLSESRENKERAISRAQLTKSGFVYIISNIGAFGENMYKIGMTRRLDPMDRIKELSSASVPFSFDVHAMIYSDNAPELERILHTFLTAKRVNLVNFRKEFFSVSINEIEKAVKEHNLEVEVIRISEAREYKETLAMKQYKNSEYEYIAINLDSDFPLSLL